MRDVGYLVRGKHEGKDTVGIRLSWEKRYITLGPNATLVGLAFRLDRSREHPRARRGPRHHRGARAGRSSRRRDRPPPSAVGRRLPERPQLGPRRLHPDRLGDRRREDGWPGLAHVDGMPGRWPLHLAAVLVGRRCQVGPAQLHRLRTHPQAVRSAHRQDGGPGGAARAHGGERLRHRSRPCRDRRHGRDAARSLRCSRRS